MKTKTSLTLLLLLTSILSFGQNIIEAKGLRKIVLKSDVILASQSYKTTANYANDYSIEQFHTVNSTDTILKNTIQFKISNKIRIQQYVDDYSAVWSECPSICSYSYSSKEIDTRYTNLFFLKKENKQYKLLGIAERIKWDDFITYYTPAISQLMQIEKISNLNERYTKTIDWFIEYKDYPDENFIAFYTQKGILQDGLILTEEQRQKAKENFLEGNDKLRPFIDKETQKAYSLEKLKDIRDLLRPDYWDFYFELSNLYEFDYNTIDYMLKSQLTNQSIDNSDKEMIMNYFIKKIEEEIEFEK